jgi:hypothetical protein
MFTLGTQRGGPELDDAAIGRKLTAAMRLAADISGPNYDDGTETWINPIYLVPGSVWKPDFEGYQLGYFSMKQKGLVVQIVVPQAVADGAGINEFIGASLREAARLAAKKFASKKLDFSMSKAERIIEAIEDGLRKMDGPPGMADRSSAERLADRAASRPERPKLSSAAPMPLRDVIVSRTSSRADQLGAMPSMVVFIAEREADEALEEDMKRELGNLETPENLKYVIFWGGEADAYEGTFDNILDGLSMRGVVTVTFVEEEVEDVATSLLHEMGADHAAFRCLVFGDDGLGNAALLIDALNQHGKEIPQG